MVWFTLRTINRQRSEDQGTVVVTMFFTFFAFQTKKRVFPKCLIRKTTYGWQAFVIFLRIFAETPKFFAFS